MMGGKVAKFGIFSPAVIVAKVVLGEKELNKVGREEGQMVAWVVYRCGGGGFMCACIYGRVGTHVCVEAFVCVGPPTPPPTLPQTNLSPNIINPTDPAQIRGKAIALHSQAITEFCYFVGAQVRKQMNTHAHIVVLTWMDEYALMCMWVDYVMWPTHTYTPLTSPLVNHNAREPQGKTRNRLIKKAKTNGDELGFLW